MRSIIRPMSIILRRSLSFLLALGGLFQASPAQVKQAEAPPFLKRIANVQKAYNALPADAREGFVLPNQWGNWGNWNNWRNWNNWANWANWNNWNNWGNWANH